MFVVHLKYVLSGTLCVCHRTVNRGNCCRCCEEWKLNRQATTAISRARIIIWSQYCGIFLQRWCFFVCLFVFYSFFYCNITRFEDRRLMRAIIATLSLVAPKHWWTVTEYILVLHFSTNWPFAKSRPPWILLLRLSSFRSLHEKFSAISVRDIPKEIISNFWKNGSEISERRQKGLQYALRATFTISSAGGVLSIMRRSLK